MKQLLLQWCGRTTASVLCLLTGLFAVGLFVFQTPWTGGVLLASALLIAIIAFFRLPYALLIVVAELLSFSHGHLITTAFFGQTFSLRMALFAGLFIGYGIGLCVRRYRLPMWLDERVLGVALLGLVVFQATMRGVLTFSPAAVFADMNAYLFLFLLFPLLTATKDALFRHRLLQTVTASAIFVAVLTLIVLFLFSHLGGTELSPVYTFFRDTRLAEITRLQDGFYRVFFQGQFTVMIAFFLIVASYLVSKTLQLRERIGFVLLMSLMMAGLVVGLSRTFWLALMVGGAGLLVWLVMSLGVRVVARRMLLVFGAVGASGVLIATVVLLPVPWLKGGVGAGWSQVFIDRTTSTQDAAVSSRWKLLTPLQETIATAPVLGFGFGKEITFETDDPRLREIHGTSIISTGALEWGWLELWLKMGIFGPLVWFFLLLCGSFAVLRSYTGTHKWFGVACTGTIVLVAVSHVFSP